MKSLAVKWLCVGLILYCNAEAWGADWRLFAETDSYHCFYDAEDAVPSSNGVVDVWAKLEYTKKGISGMVKKFGKHYDDLSYSLELWEINCPKRKDRLLSITEYSAEGKILYANSAEGRHPAWKMIPRKSVDEDLYYAVCK